jgi:hypothetical protein
MLVARPLRLQPASTAPQKCPRSCSTSSPLQLGRGREARLHHRYEYWSAEDRPLSDCCPSASGAPWAGSFRKPSMPSRQLNWLGILRLMCDLSLYLTSLGR